MLAASALLPPQHAAFAVTSRLLSCFVTEHILKAFYIPMNDSSHASGIVIILAAHSMSEHPTINWVLHARDVFAIVPVHHPPVFQGTSVFNYGRPVGLLDPLDMLPDIYEMTTSLEPTSGEFQKKILNSLSPSSWELCSCTTLVSSTDPIHFWSKFVDNAILADNIQEGIREELRSSYDWQLLAYESPPQCPSWDSAPIDWEQSLVSGHPTHPMHRARTLPFALTNYDWYRPRLRFVAVPRSSMGILGPFESNIRSLAERVANRSGFPLPDNALFAIIPVHELQIHNIQARMPDVEILHCDISVQALAQSSIRTVTIPEMPSLAVKLAVGVKISSALRTVSHFTTDFGPRFSEELIPKLTYDRELLVVEREPASAIYRSADPDIAKHLSVVLREEYQPRVGEKVMVCAALLEMDHLGCPPGVAAVQHVLGLDSPEKRYRFLDQSVATFVRVQLLK
ncbi:hypothetical protein AX17_006585 [Amanita inopinata Kibby_2008]|nr:hypothetical protein AX17_006585 [Amanita inopinata Kibby_2008]